MPLPLMPFVGAGRKSRSLLDMVKDAGLRSALAMCFDVGCKQSWAGSGQLLDMSGHGYHFALGAGAAAPTFVGSVGKQTAVEAFQSDGGDYLTLASGANDTFINGWHKTGADFSLLTIMSPVNGVNAPHFTTKAGSTTGNNNVGTVMDTFSGNAARLTIGNGSSTLLDQSTVLTVNAQPNMVAVGVQLISNTNRNSFDYVNGTDKRGNSTAAFTLSTAAAGAALRMGSSADLSIIWANGFKFHAAAAFNRMLTQAELDALRTYALRRWTTI